jgi:hypothetical protein
MNSVSREEVATLIDEALARQAAAHAAEMTALDVALAELKTVIQALSVADTSQNKPDFVPLKRAASGAVSYESLRQWCEKGLVVSRKSGSRWFVDRTRAEAGEATCFSLFFFGFDFSHSARAETIMFPAKTARRIVNARFR